MCASRSTPDWLYHLPVGWMALVVFAGTALIAAVVYGVAIALAARGRAPMLKAISPVTLTPLAVLFGLIVAFLSFQVWSNAHRANAAIAHEASALRSVVLPANFPRETEVRVQALVRRHIQDAVSQEWPAMARQARGAACPRRLTSASTLHVSRAARCSIRSTSFHKRHGRRRTSAFGILVGTVHWV